MNIAIIVPGALFVGFSLGMFGSGGSILTVPILVYLLGQDEKVAIASSLAIVGLVSFFGSLTHAKEKLIDWRTVAIFGVPGIVGTYLGAWSSVLVSGTAQLMVFAIVMLLASYMMLRESTINETTQQPRAIHKIALDGILVGMLTGFVGVGGGFLIVPALVSLGGLSMQSAIATSLVIITLKSLSGYLKYMDVLAAEGLQVDPFLIAFFAVAGVIGTFGGNALASKLPQQQLRNAFAIFLIIMGVFILSKSILF
jgi:hypothetical protein